jgi:hypothetical protein
MVSPIAAASAAARAASQSVRGESVTYTRGAYSLTLTAVRGSTAWDRSAPFNGVRVGDRSTDWILEAADLVDSNGDQIKPARQDEITVDGVTFRVMPYGPDNQLWMYHDRDRTYIRVHTKERV